MAMKKLVLFVFMTLMSLEGWATTPEFGGKHIKTITWTDGKDTEVGELKYDEAGRIKEYLIDGKSRDKYAYSDNSITITENGDTYEYTISNGRVVSGKTSLDGGEVDIDRTFKYNLDGQLVTILNKEKESGYSEVYTIIESWEWRNGNLSMKTLLDDEDTETSLFTYNSITTEPMMRILFGFGQERHLDDFYELLAIYPYMGKLPNNLFERIKHRDAEDREWEYNYTYEQNGNGDIAKVTISFKDKTYVYTFEWEGSEGSEEGSSDEDSSQEAIKITSAGQTTWCSAYDLDFSNVEGLKAYTATGYHRTKGTIWLTRVKEVPAGEGILLIGDAGDYKVPHKSTTAYYANLMVGTVKAITLNETDGEYTNYYLSNGDSGVGFYKVNGSVDLKANRAYLPLLKNTTNSSRGFIGLDFDDGEEGTTGIRNTMQATEKDVWYNLQGQRVERPGKGLYIRNGCKVVMK